MARLLINGCYIKIGDCYLNIGPLCETPPDFTLAFWSEVFGPGLLDGDILFIAVEAVVNGSAPAKPTLTTSGCTVTEVFDIQIANYGNASETLFGRWTFWTVAVTADGATIECNEVGDFAEGWYARAGSFPLEIVSTDADFVKVIEDAGNFTISTSTPVTVIGKVATIGFWGAATDPADNDPLFVGGSNINAFQYQKDGPADIATVINENTNNNEETVLAAIAIREIR
jgi:hypothetical protein